MACCIFEETYYEEVFINQVKELKIKHFNDPDIIFHSRDIRKWQNQFKCLGDINKRSDFYKDLDNLIKKSEFKIIASAINKDKLIQLYGPRADNPYNISLSFVYAVSVNFIQWYKICNQLKV